MGEPLTIMVGNDDGVHSIGIDALAREAKSWGKINIIAPNKQQTAKAKSLTFHKPIRISETVTSSDQSAIAYNTSPADSILIHNHLFGSPDLVFSGINSGENTSVHSILTSGTVAVAMEAGLQNIPAFAFSMDVPEEYFYRDNFPGKIKTAGSIAIKTAKTLYEKLPQKFWEVTLFVNVNFPDQIDDTTTIELVELENHKYENYLVERTDPKGESYFWLWGDKRTDFDPTKDSYKVLKEKVITLTPVSLTHLDYAFDQAEQLIEQLNAVI